MAGFVWRHKNFSDTFQLNDILGNVHKHLIKQKRVLVSDGEATMVEGVALKIIKTAQTEKGN